MKPQTPWGSSISECSCFEPEANCPITYQSDIYLIYYYQMLAGRKKTQPNNNKTLNPDQENQETLKACTSISKPVSVCPEHWQYQKEGSLSGSNSALICNARMMPLKLRELLAGWPAQWTSCRTQVSLT